MCLHNCIYFMVFSIAKFNEVYFVKRNLWLLKKIALQKRHSLSAPEEEGTRACRTESADLDWIAKPSYVFPLRIQIILRTQFRGIGAFSNVKGRWGRWGTRWAHRTPRQAYTFTSTQISQSVVCIVMWNKKLFIARNLNSFRIVHYQIFDVQTSILLHVLGFF